MVRKVTLNRSEVELAKHFGVSLEDAAKAKLPKRGRPVGSKNKKKVIKAYAPQSFDDAIKEWDRMDAEAELVKRINWEEVAQKQEVKLAAYIAENDELARICVMRWEEIQHLKYLVKYLEGKHEDASV